jgi:hypothetical protein
MISKVLWRDHLASNLRRSDAFLETDRLEAFSRPGSHRGFSDAIAQWGFGDYSPTRTTITRYESRSSIQHTRHSEARSDRDGRSKAKDFGFQTHARDKLMAFGAAPVRLRSDGLQ